jgi:nucleoside-diphosphate-sugar epimerase/intein/homing endonuclease
VTGGTGFIGSELVNALLDRKVAALVVADQLMAPNVSADTWKRRLDRYYAVCRKHDVEPNLEIIDLSTERERLKHILTKNNVDTVFMLSAVFGGRGFVDTQQSACSIGFAIDQNTIRACHESGTVERISYSSSACLLPHTRVLLNSHGALPICRLLQGDTCVDHEGRANEIVRVSSRQYTGEILKIRVAGLPSTIDVTPEHPFLCPRGPTGGLRWVSARELRTGDHVYIPRFASKTSSPCFMNLYPYADAQTKRYFRFKAMSTNRRQAMKVCGEIGIDKTTFYRWRRGMRPRLVRTATRISSASLPVDEDLAWLMGLYAAEGWVERDMNAVFSLGDELELMRRLSGIVLRKFGYRMKVHRLRNQAGYKLHLNVPLVARWLKDKIGAKSSQKKIPEEIMNGEVGIAEAFLLGYLQGDGNIHLRDGRSPRISCATVSEQLAWQLFMLFGRLGFLPGLYRGRPRPGMVEGRIIVGKNNLHLYFSGPQAYELARRIYGIKLERRTGHSAQESASQASRTIVHKRTGGFKRRIMKIERDFYDGLVYNLHTLRDTHSYTAYGVAVHNCVYPPSLNKPGYLLKESDVLSTGEGLASSDNLYGFQKIMTELTLRVFSQEHGLKTSSCRFLTVYGAGEFPTTHAISMLCERALKRENPFVVWGSGQQERGFTYVTDIVEGQILAAEKIADGTAVNLGWDKRYKIRDVVSMILDIVGYKPEVIYDKTKPEGPFSRALDISLAKQLLGWTPKVDLREGLERTIEWMKGSVFR